MKSKIKVLVLTMLLTGVFSVGFNVSTQASRDYCPYMDPCTSCQKKKSNGCQCQRITGNDGQPRYVCGT